MEQYKMIEIGFSPHSEKVTTEHIILNTVNHGEYDRFFQINTLSLQIYYTKSQLPVWNNGNRKNYIHVACNKRGHHD